MTDPHPEQAPQSAAAAGPPKPPTMNPPGLEDAFPDDFFGPSPAIIDLQAQDRFQALDELLDNLAASGKIQTSHKEPLALSLRTRETTMSTGLGFGIANPHASTPLLSEPLAIIGRSRPGIPFASMDGKPVHLVFLLLLPAHEFQKHLQIFAKLAEALQQPAYRDRLWNRFM